LEKITNLGHNNKIEYSQASIPDFSEMARLRINKISSGASRESSYMSMHSGVKVQENEILSGHLHKSSGHGVNIL